MTLPGMRERTVRIGSAGKSFSLTGWKVGYVTAPLRSDEVDRQDPSVHDLHHAAQPAMGRGDRPAARRRLLLDAWPPTCSASAIAWRDALADIGFEVLPAHGTYFVTTDFRPLGFNGTDEDFCRHITVEAGVTAVPVSAFYDDPRRAPRHFARFCFCKHDETLDSAIDRLEPTFQQVNQRLKLESKRRRRRLQSIQFVVTDLPTGIFDTRLRRRLPKFCSRQCQNMRGPCRRPAMALAPTIAPCPNRPLPNHLESMAAACAASEPSS